MFDNKLKTKKEKFIFFMAVIFFITSMLTKVRSINIDLKESKNKQIQEKQQQITQIQNINKFEKSKYILGLSDTLEEAIGYINDDYNNSKKEPVKIMVQDCIKALDSIERALEPMYNNLNNKNIKTNTNILKESFNELYKAINDNKKDRIENILNENIISEYSKWKYDVESEFRK